MHLYTHATHATILLAVGIVASTTEEEMYVSVSERMRPWIAKAAAGIIVLAVSAVSIGLTSTPASAACAQEWGNGTDTRLVTFSGSDLNLRYQANTSSCVKGTIKSGHTLRYLCWWTGTNVNGWTSWTYLYNSSIQKWGWASDYYLPYGGSSKKCTSVEGTG